MAINFHNKDIDYTIDDKSFIQKWLTLAIKDNNYSLGTVNYIFCTDNYLLSLNEKYLAHDTLTDIITFDYSSGNVVSGDIFISIERVTENANIYCKTFHDELYRVLVHGVLHLCGYKDKTDEESTKMRMMEDHYLSISQQ